MTNPRLPVSRSGRALDLLALLCVAGGGIGWFVSYLGLERLRSAPAVAFSRGMSIDQLSQFQELAHLSYWSRGAVAAGVICAVASWFRERRRTGGPGS